jgi:hypothetical protein
MTPFIISSSSLSDEAADLVYNLANNHDDTYGLGNMTCAVYDTAWVAMLAKQVEGKLTWLFPESFNYLLDRQGEDGAWESYGAQVDGIMNSLAALLALKRHQKQPQLSEDALPDDIETRIQRAIDAISQQLQAWDVETTMHVGFEYLVPALLAMLEAESIQFHFSGRDKLMSINHKKMSRFQPDMLYGEKKITALHSLEAFIGLIDFDRVQHHKTFGSMMASPSSTVAYLMSASQWDLESEAYLRHVIGFGDGKFSGGVPSAFPSNYFETTWVRSSGFRVIGPSFLADDHKVVSTLLEAGFSRENLGQDNLETIGSKLQHALNTESGLIGFGEIPYLLPQLHFLTLI